MGIINTDPAVRLNATFAPTPPEFGRVAMSTQSGALGLAAGAAVSALMYFGLLTIPAGRLFQVTSGLITLLAAGMAVPFAIAVPGVVYLLLQHGLVSLKGIGLVSWGSMNSFTLTAIPLFVLMAE